MTKEDQKKTKNEKTKKKAKTSTIKGTITEEQKNLIQQFIGILGSNEQDVVGKILTLWLYNEGYLNLNKK